MVKMIINNQADALGQRICKIDSVASATTLYYYNDNWQVLAEYNTSGTVQSQYIYGNYIDEVLFAATPSGLYYYAHDHLYSPAALLSNTDGSVLERYEYDAYGKATVYTNMSDWDTSTPTTQSYSAYANPYTFTGRRLDSLNSNTFDIMYYRNRYYDTETGRFSTHDPLSFQLSVGYIMAQPFRQYGDGLNLFQYVTSNPLLFMDPYGLAKYKQPEYDQCIASANMHYKNALDANIQVFLDLFYNLESALNAGKKYCNDYWNAGTAFSEYMRIKCLAGVEANYHGTNVIATKAYLMSLASLKNAHLVTIGYCKLKYSECSDKTMPPGTGIW